MIPPWQDGRNVCLEGHPSPHDSVPPNRHDENGPSSDHHASNGRSLAPFQGAVASDQISGGSAVLHHRLTYFVPSGLETGQHTHSNVITGKPHIFRNRLEIDDGTEHSMAICQVARDISASFHWPSSSKCSHLRWPKFSALPQARLASRPSLSGERTCSPRYPDRPRDGDCVRQPWYRSPPSPGNSSSTPLSRWHSRRHLS